jgi:integrase
LGAKDAERDGQIQTAQFLRKVIDWALVREEQAAPRPTQLVPALSRATAWADDDDLVFAHPATGRPLDRSKVLKRFKAAMRRAKLGHRLGEGGITFHSLRHCFGTRMAAQGVPMRTLQELMGTGTSPRH